MNGCFFFAKLIAQVGGNRDKVISWGLNYLWLYFFKPSISKMEFSLRERLTYSFPRDRDTYLWKLINSIKWTKTPDVSCSNISQCNFKYNTFLAPKIILSPGTRHVNESGRFRAETK